MRILVQLGYEPVATADHGQQALEILVNTTPTFDILIVDLNMPEMDGVEFMRLAHEANYQGGILLLSGEGKRTLEIGREFAGGQQLNVIGFLAKPLRPDLLEEMIDCYEPRQEQDKRHFSPQAPITEEELKSCINREGPELTLFYQQ